MENKTYTDGLKEVLSILEDHYSQNCPHDNWDDRCDLVRKIVDAVYADVGAILNPAQGDANDVV